MRIISFGCSLSRQGSDNIEFPNHYNLIDKDSGVIRTLAKELSLDYKNYAFSSSSLANQVDRFHHYMVDDYKSDDIILWQMTNFSRSSWDISIDNEHAWSSNIDLERKNSIVSDYYILNSDGWGAGENYTAVNLLSHNQLARDDIFKYHRKVYKNFNYRWEKHLVNALSCQKIIKNLGNPILVWFGWYGALVQQKGKNKANDYNELFESKLKKEGIAFESKRYTEWCIKKNMTMLDTLHPCPFDSAPIYARIVLLPRLKKLLNETSQ